MSSDPPTIPHFVASTRKAIRRSELVALDPSRFAGHSLRSGLATQAAANGVDDRAIMRQTGHRDRRMLDRYVREGRLFRDNAAAGVGL